jgi:simple sugar transport system permease protein
LGAVAAALLLAAIPLAAAGAPVARAFSLMAAGAAGSVFALTETLTRATPLIFTGLAAAVAFRARLFKSAPRASSMRAPSPPSRSGAELSMHRPPILVPLILLAAALAGALLMLGPTL